MAKENETILETNLRKTIEDRDQALEKLEIELKETKQALADMIAKEAARELSRLSRPPGVPIGGVLIDSESDPAPRKKIVDRIRDAADNLLGLQEVAPPIELIDRIEAFTSSMRIELGQARADLERREAEPGALERELRVKREEVRSLTRQNREQEFRGNSVAHWHHKATAYGAIVHGCTPALARAGYKTDGGTEGPAKSIAAAVEDLVKKRDEALERVRLFEIENAEVLELRSKLWEASQELDQLRSQALETRGEWRAACQREEDALRERDEARRTIESLGVRTAELEKSLQCTRTEWENECERIKLDFHEERKAMGDVKDRLEKTKEELEMEWAAREQDLKTIAELRKQLEEALRKKAPHKTIEEAHRNLEQAEASVEECRKLEAKFEAECRKLDIPERDLAADFDVTTFVAHHPDGTYEVIGENITERGATRAEDAFEIPDPYAQAKKAFEKFASVHEPHLPTEKHSALQVMLHRWEVAMFDGGNLEESTMGACEESGELSEAAVLILAANSAAGRMARCIIKRKHGQRGMGDEETFRRAMADAIADLAIYAIGASTKLRLDFWTLLAETAAEVMNRHRPGKEPARSSELTPGGEAAREKMREEFKADVDLDGFREEVEQASARLEKSKPQPMVCIRCGQFMTAGRLHVCGQEHGQ